MIDILEGKILERSCLDKGMVRLVDVMPRLVPEGQTADAAIVQAARVSYGEGTKTITEDEGLIRYLLRHRHTTPIEQVEFKFLVKLPIFVARQFIRHRMMSFNEYSARYSVVKDEYYLPEIDDVRAQSKTNKQGGCEPVDEYYAKEFTTKVVDHSSLGYARYLSSLEDGISREQSRIMLSLNYYTEWYCKVDLHNLLHFLALRCDSHAQKEIRVYGDAMLDLIRPIVPIAVQAWEDYHPLRGAILLTKLEVDAIRGETAIASENKREIQEWLDKKSKLGLNW